jgi:hypothetical protein
MVDLQARVKRRLQFKIINSNPSLESQSQIALQQYYHNELAQKYKI